MREPVFNETLQLGIVARDLEATMRRYVHDCGIGPREVLATVGQVQWQLIEPLDDESVYARFLAEKGDHHVAEASGPTHLLYRRPAP